MKHNTSLFIKKNPWSNYGDSYGPPTYDEWAQNQNGLPSNTNRFDWSGLIKTAIDSLSGFIKNENPQQQPAPTPSPGSQTNRMQTYTPYIFLGIVLLVGMVIIKKLV